MSEVWSWVPEPVVLDHRIGQTIEMRWVDPVVEMERAIGQIRALMAGGGSESLLKALQELALRVAPELSVWENEGGSL